MKTHLRLFCGYEKQEASGLTQPKKQDMQSTQNTPMGKNLVGSNGL